MIDRGGKKLVVHATRRTHLRLLSFHAKSRNVWQW